MEQDLLLMKLLNDCGHILAHRRCLNQSQNTILSILKQQGPLTQKDLMQIMRIRSGSLSELLGKVEDAGYISRCRLENDKRNVEVFLTAEGKKQAELFELHQAEMAKRLFECLAPAEKQQLADMLAELLDAWSDFKSCRHCRRGDGKNV